MRKQFVLNDETKKNNYGFRILNKGINLERFLDNPVCLNDHKNTTKDTLGLWYDLQFKENLFLGSVEFDTEDVEGKEVVRKVNADVLKATSLGFDFIPENFEVIDGELTLIKCELKEISIVAVPSHARTIRLYDKSTGNALSDSEIQAMCLSAKNNPINIKKVTMKKVLSHLQLSDASGEDAVLEAIKALEGKLKAKGQEHDALQLKYETLEQAQTAKLKAEFDEELATAVKDGRLDEEGKAPIEAMVLKSGYDQGMKLLKALPKRNTIADKLQGKEAKLKAYEGMSWTELDKGGHLMTLKADMPDYYAERFEKHFGTEPK